MKLSNSEVLLLTQVLYHVKSADGYLDDQIDELHEKLCSHILSSLSGAQLEKDDHNDDEELTDHCVWHEENSFNEKDQNSEDDHEDDVEVTIKSLQDLDSVRVLHEHEKCDFIFEKGLKSSIDINLNDGEQILCDVTHIVRYAKSLDVECAEGNVSFEIQKFPKSWTALLQSGVHYKVV